MDRLIKFLRRQGCVRIVRDGNTVRFVSPAGDDSSVTLHRGGGLTEKIGETTFEHATMTALRRAWL